MRQLLSHEIPHVNGGEDEMFNGFLLGTIAGGLAGAYVSMRFVSHRPLLAMMLPQTMDNIIKAGVIGGAVIGGLCGTVIGALSED